MKFSIALFSALAILAASAPIELNEQKVVVLGRQKGGSSGPPGGNGSGRVSLSFLKLVPFLLVLR